MHWGLPKMKVLFIPDYSEGNPYQKLLKRSLEEMGIEVILLNPYRMFPFFRMVLMHWKTEIIHIHWVNQLAPKNKNTIKTALKLFMTMIDLLIVKTMKVKIIWSIHNKFTHECVNVKGELLLRRILAKFSDKLIVHCKHVKYELGKLYKVNEKKFVIIPHGNYINYYNNVNNKRKVNSRRHLNLNRESIVFLYFGAIRKYKGIPKLLKTFDKVKHPKAELLVVGNPFEKRLKEIIVAHSKTNSGLHYVLKFVPENEVYLYFNASDIVIVPFEKILTSGSIILAMSFGKPIIAPLIGCIPAYLDKKGAFLYDKDDKYGLIKAIHKALNTPRKELEKMGKHNYRKISKLDWRKIGEMTFMVYKEVLKS